MSTLTPYEEQCDPRFIAFDLVLGIFQRGVMGVSFIL
jgi:hypothetical protein